MGNFPDNRNAMGSDTLRRWGFVVNVTKGGKGKGGRYGAVSVGLKLLARRYNLFILVTKNFLVTKINKLYIAWVRRH